MKTPDPQAAGSHRSRAGAPEAWSMSVICEQIHPDDSAVTSAARSAEFEVAAPHRFRSRRADR